jgi:hypothetical protein
MSGCVMSVSVSFMHEPCVLHVYAVRWGLAGVGLPCILHGCLTPRSAPHTFPRVLQADVRAIVEGQFLSMRVHMEAYVRRRNWA